MEPTEKKINVQQEGELIEQVPGGDGSENRNGKSRVGGDVEERQ